MTAMAIGYNSLDASIDPRYETINRATVNGAR